MSVDFTVRLNEKVSGPARRAKVSVEQLAVVMKQQRSAAASAKAASEALARKVAAAGNAARKSSADWRTLASVQAKSQARTRATSLALPKTSRGLSDLAGNFASVLGPAALAAGALVVVTKALRAVVSAAVSAGKAIISTAAFLDDAAISFKAITGSASKGEAALERVLNISAKLGLPVKETTKQFQKLLALQFTPRAAESMIKLAADLRFLGATAEQSNSVLRAMGQIFSKGRLQGEELLQLAEAGVSTKLVLDALAKATGKNTEEVQKLISAGKINAKQGIEAIKAAVLAKAKTSELGEAAAKTAGTIGGSFSGLRSQVELLVFRLAKKVLPTIKGELGPAFQDLQKILRSPAAAKALDVMASGFRILAKAAGLLLKVAGGLVEGLVKGLSGGAEAAGKLEDKFELTPEQIDSAVQAAIKFGTAIGNAVNNVLRLVNAVSNLLAKFERLSSLADSLQAGGLTGDLVTPTVGGRGFRPFDPSELDSMTQALTTGGRVAGKGLVDGLVAGIAAGASSVISAATNMAMSAITAAKSALGIASPSKVFEGFGEQSAMGFQQGITGQGGATASTSAGAVQPAEVLGGTGATAPTTASVGGVNMTFQFEITGSADPQETAEAVRRMALDGLSEAFEQLAIEQGVLAGV